jgi:osmoprotectant transport system ATP-binding protein
LIRFDKISKNYKGKEVLTDITFEIPAGNLVTLIGASGCGKTTSLKMINRLVEPTSGVIYIDGVDISTKDVIKLRRNMGYVIQQTGLFPHMTVRDNIEIIPRLEGYDEKVLHQKTLDMMEMIGLDSEEFLNRYPTELSGGQQQRIGVARAFVTDPEIILMDEPFSALDPLTKVGLQHELLELQAKFKKTIVFVTHDMEEAIKISDRICIMDEGNIIQYDTPEEILRNPHNEFISNFVGKKRIWGSPEYIKVEDIMLKTPITCTKNMSLIQGMEIMRGNKVDSLIVVDGISGKMEGIINGAHVHRHENKSLKMGDVMSTDFMSVHPKQNILDVLKMIDKSISTNVSVLDNNGELIGLITKSSLITTFSQQYFDGE